MSSSIMLQVLSPLGVEPVNLTMDENPEVILLVADVILWPSRYLGIKSRSNRVYISARDKLTTKFFLLRIQINHRHRLLSFVYICADAKLLALRI